METILIDDWIAYKNIIETKNLLVQYAECATEYKLYASEGGAFIWAIVLNKSGTDAEDFENNYKADCNKPLEYRSSDGLVKIASAKFVESLGFYLTGETNQADLSSNSVGYIKYHFDAPYTLSGVAAIWKDANFGDYLDFEVGVYASTEESSFISISKFASQFKIMDTGHILIDVPTVKTIPSTVDVGYGETDTYIRIKAANTGSSASKVIVNLIGWM